MFVAATIYTQAVAQESSNDTSSNITKTATEAANIIYKQQQGISKENTFLFALGPFSSD